MYLPAVFANEDRASVLAHVEAHPFATLVTTGTSGHDGPSASHVPLLLSPGRDRLRGHLARDNPQRRDLASGRPALAIFHGPHGYVSPSVYGEAKSVPTWNYVVVHARGRARLLEDGELRALVDETVARFDRTGWRLSEDPEFLRRMLGAIVGFEIAIEELWGKWKISQNRPAADVPRVVEWLERGDDASRALADIMRARATGRGS